MSGESLTYNSIMRDLVKRIPEETPVRIVGKRIPISPKQVIFYDPKATPEFAHYIYEHLKEIKEWFQDLDYEFCYIPDMCSEITDEKIRYLIPNWEGGILEWLDCDLLKSWLFCQRGKLGAGFVRLDNGKKTMCKHFPLVPPSKIPWDEQLDQYKYYLLERYRSCNQICGDQIRFSISTAHEDDSLFSFFETKISLADQNFSEEAISDEVKRIVEQLQTEGFAEFVLRCMVPVEPKLSRIVITPSYEIVLPDYGNLLIEMSPLPKAIYLLFLKHEEGLFFKELVDYKDELRSIYEKITNRTNTNVIDDSLDKVTDPTNNAINEKNSRITEAFVKHIDKSLAKSYCLTGLRSERKRITLPRKLVEWQCELPL